MRLSEVTPANLTTRVQGIERDRKTWPCRMPTAAFGPGLGGLTLTHSQGVASGPEKQ